MNLKRIQLTKKRDNVEFEVQNTEYNFTGKTNFVRCVGLVAPKKKKKKKKKNRGKVLREKDELCLFSKLDEDFFSKRGVMLKREERS